MSIRKRHPIVVHTLYRLLVPALLLGVALGGPPRRAAQARVGAWSATGSIGTARDQHIATLLSNGQALSEGGENGNGTQTSTELYHPEAAAGPVCDVPGDYSAIQAAVDDPTCETVNLTAALYVENVTINRTVTIQGHGPANTAVDGNASGSVFTITANGHVTLTAVTITNGLGGTRIAPPMPGSTIVHVIGCTISGNEGSGIVNSGGRFSEASLYVTNSTLSGNSASNGGGIYNAGYAQVYLTSSTLSGNSANNGGGIYNSGGGVEIANSTLSDNSATQGGSIHNVWYDEAPYGGFRYFRATNSIVANSPSGGDCVNDVDARFADNGYNIVEDGTCISASTSSSGDPALGPLQDNGGPTLTHALLEGSPAIDSGDDTACPASDQRGVPRPQDGDGDGAARCDVGAFELVREFLVYLPLVER